MPRPAKFRFLIDEDIDVGVIHFLKAAGHDVIPIPKGFKNGSVYRMTLKTRRILLSGDKDFSDSLRYPALQTKGIVVVRIHPTAPAFVIPVLKMLLTLSPKRIKGRLVLLEPEGIRFP